MKKFNNKLDEVIKENSDKLKFTGKGITSRLPRTSWLDNYKNGGDVSLPNVYPNQMVPKFEEGGDRGKKKKKGTQQPVPQPEPFDFKTNTFIKSASPRDNTSMFVMPPLSQGQRVSIPYNEDFNKSGITAKNFLNDWYQARVNDPRYGKVAKQRIAEIPNIKTVVVSPEEMAEKNAGGYYLQGGKKIYLDSTTYPQSSVNIHESTHELYNQVPQKNQDEIIKKFLINEKSWRKKNQGNYSYFSNPTEVASRLNQFRRLYNIDPRKKYTDEDMRKIIKRHERVGENFNWFGDPNSKKHQDWNFGDSDVDELLEIIGRDPAKLAQLNDEIVMNLSQRGMDYVKTGGSIVQQKAYGGTTDWINKYEEGGSLDCPCPDQPDCICPETTYTHQPAGKEYNGKLGESYMLKRTQTPYTNYRDIRRYTQAPTDPRQVNFLSNYAGAIGEPLMEGYGPYPTEVPFEGAKHWNIDRFIIDPQFSNKLGNLKADESTLEQNRNNVLSDMYKYYMLQDPEHKGKAFRKAKRFVRKEVDPRIKGEFLKAYNEEDLGTITGFTDQNHLKDLYWNQAIGEGTVTPDDVEKLKKVSMDYFKNYRKMSKKDAEALWNSWERGAAQLSAGDPAFYNNSTEMSEPLVPLKYGGGAGPYPKFPSTGMLTSVGAGPKVPTMKKGGQTNWTDKYKF